MFGRVGQIVVSGSKFDEVFDNAIEAGAVEIEDLDGEVIVYTKVEDLHKAKENLVRQGVKISQAEIVYRPNKDTLVVVGEEKKAVVNDFLGLLDDFPDTQSVYANINDFI
jgi:transcriptional/translational regulatory protein YebC/TACO1